MATGDMIDMIHLPPSLQIKTGATDSAEQGKFGTIIETQERALIIDALKETKGNQSQAALILGTTKRIIHYKIKKFGIDPGRFRSKVAGESSLYRIL
jgi:Nif-specific regulatory protein